MAKLNIMKKLIFVFTLIALSHTLLSQNPDSSKFIDVSFIKSKSADYVNFEKNVWKPINQQMIKEGKKSGWYLYKLKYPQGTEAEYDYIVVNVFPDWNQLTFSSEDLTAVLKNMNSKWKPDSLLKKTDANRSVAWRQLYRLIGQAVAKEKEPSKYLIINAVKPIAGQEGEYVKMEQTYFKPFHTARAAEGIMNNWGLYKRELPYGEKFDYDYVTFNGYATWNDITKQNPPTAWKKVHGDLNFNEVHEKILSKRITVNIECWELIDYAVK
jgi:hypothetical protein